MALSSLFSSHSLVGAVASTFSSIPTGILCYCVSCFVIALIVQFPQQRAHNLFVFTAGITQHTALPVW